jgi:outer membrane lipoprotein SlyB
MLVAYNIPFKHLKICIAHGTILSDRINKNKKGVVTPDAMANMVYYTAKQERMLISLAVATIAAYETVKLHLTVRNVVASLAGARFPITTRSQPIF